MLRLIAALLKEMRPKQWTKNALLFAGIIFSQHLGELPRLLDAISGFLIFCGLSSVIYIFNDLHDIQSDRAHPLKRNRPLASGALPVPVAIAAGIFLAAGSLVWSFAVNWRFGAIAAGYFALMLLYTSVIKHVVILDLLVVALGFVIRAVAGVLAIENPGETLRITPWFLTCVMFLALFIVICKRRHEILLLSTEAKQHRPVLEHYSEAFLDQMVSLATTATVMSYTLYAILGVRDMPKEPGALMSPKSHDTMVYTVPFVLYGVCRYLYLVYKKEEGGAPENLVLQDWSLLINVLLWLTVIVYIFY